MTRQLEKHNATTRHKAETAGKKMVTADERWIEEKLEDDEVREALDFLRSQKHGKRGFAHPLKT